MNLTGRYRSDDAIKTGERGGSSSLWWYGLMTTVDRAILPVNSAAAYLRVSLAFRAGDIHLF